MALVGKNKKKKMALSGGIFFWAVFMFSGNPKKPGETSAAYESGDTAFVGSNRTQTVDGKRTILTRRRRFVAEWQRTIL